MNIKNESKEKLEVKKKKVLIEDVFQSKSRIQILKVFALEDELNISEIVRRTHLNHKKVHDELNFFVEVNILQEKIFGHIRIYRFKIENLEVRALRNLFDIWKNGF